MILIRGARTHNLKDVTVSIPENALVVVTGPSGAGKSSLAFDTLYAEAQRRYLEALNVRAFELRLPRPDVDAIDNLPPAIAIEQRGLTRSRRSSIGTVTEITDHLRVLYARVGTPHCPICGDVVRAESAEQVVDSILSEPPGTKIIVRAPIARAAKGDLREELDRLRKDGYVRAIADGVTIDLGEVAALDKKRGHDLDAVVDRIVVKEGARSRTTDSVELAMRLGGGRVRIARDERITFHSQRFACEKDDFVFPPIEPALFSTNAPEGACPTCEGLGVRSVATEERLVDRALSLRKGAIVAWGAPTNVAYALKLKRAVDATGVDPDVAWKKLPAAKRAELVAFVDQHLDDEDEDEDPIDAARFREELACAECGGSGLRREARAVEIGGLSLGEVSALPLPRAREAIAAIRSDIGKPLIDAAVTRLDALLAIGLDHLSLDRRTDTLSTGEGERARIAGQLAGGLRGVLYVLDEPSRGMHASDTDRLLAVLLRLRDRGSTVLMVEHDLGLISRADHVIDVAGGRVVAEGPPASLGGVTGPWLAGKRLPPVARVATDERFAVRGITARNLRDVDLEIPLGALTCVTGPSGSGKSTLIFEGLVPKALTAPGIERVIAIDAAPLGRSARSNPATATGIMARLRELFASLPEAKARGYKAARFSTNVKGGRCENCGGEGVVRVELRLLPDVTVPCSICRGARFNRETLEVRYRGLSIADVLNTSVDDAQRLFEPVPAVRERLDAMRSLGLGYLPLGQPATTLSGGEAQRVKLAREIARGARARAMYILDEPTAGLHADDVAVLLEALVALRDQGNTVIVIEHDLALAARADHVIDLGPGAGAAGGKIMAAGTPEQVAKSQSPSAAALAGVLARDP
jgi:excinuclease ABC subunit A